MNFYSGIFIISVFRTFILLTEDTTNCWYSPCVITKGSRSRRLELKYDLCQWDAAEFLGVSVFLVGPHLEKGNISTDFKCLGAKYPLLLLLYVDTKGTQSRSLAPKLEHVPLMWHQNLRVRVFQEGLHPQKWPNNHQVWAPRYYVSPLPSYLSLLLNVNT